MKNENYKKIKYKKPEMKCLGKVQHLTGSGDRGTQDALYGRYRPGQSPE
ncbi:MAG: hypothetical protein ACQESP_08810 [Candidatus Muiribacteriota bacterium]